MPAPTAMPASGYSGDCKRVDAVTQKRRCRGQCTLAAARMEASIEGGRLRGLDLPPFDGPPIHPEGGGLGAITRGATRKSKAILLLAHIDTVEDKREDWKRVSFKLAEENGNSTRAEPSTQVAEPTMGVDYLGRTSARKKLSRRATHAEDGASPGRGTVGRLQRRTAEGW